MNIRVLPIPPIEAHPWLLVRHYAKRIPSISYAFGAFDGPRMVGVCTFGTPPSSPLRVGIAGVEWAEHVLELNRLCCESVKNLASRLVAGAIRQLPRPAIVVSYADTSMGHVGHVYKACGFLYTGLSAVRTDWVVDGLEHLHGVTIADMSRGQENRAEWMREQFGDRFRLEDRPRKHRYVKIHAGKTDAVRIREALRYPVEPYPVGDSKRYDASGPLESQSGFGF